MAYIRLKYEDKVVAFVNEHNIVSIEPSYEDSVIVKTVTADLYKCDYASIKHMVEGVIQISAAPVLLNEEAAVEKKK